jgi:hypothetical protein
MVTSTGLTSLSGFLIGMSQGTHLWLCILVTQDHRAFRGLATVATGDIGVHRADASL